MLGSMLGAGERAGMEHNSPVGRTAWSQPSQDRSDGSTWGTGGRGGEAGSGTSPGTVWGRGKLSDEGR